MELVIRKGEHGWGFVEKYNYYSGGGRVRIDAVVGVSPEGKLVKPYVYRGKDFIPASQIDEEMGLNKYIAAKKPFYSMLSDGFIASIGASYDVATGKFVPEKSRFSIYTVDAWQVSTINEGTLNVRSVIDIPKEVEELIVKIQEEIVKYGCDRELFLKSRF